MTYSQEIRVKERLPNGEYILEIDGVEHRSITASHAREIAERRILLEFQARELEILRQRVVLLETQADAYKKMFELRTQELERAEKLMKRSRLATFFDSAPMVVITRVGLPLFTVWASLRR
jgi:hypothetical protein